MRGPLACLLSLLASCAFTSIGFAQSGAQADVNNAVIEPKTSEDADALLTQGARLFAEEASYEEALDAFTRSFDLRPTWKALNGIGLVYQAQGRLLDALDTYEQLIARFGPELSEKQRGTVDGRMRDLEQRIGRVFIEASQEGVTIELDGKPLGVSPLSTQVRVLEGVHVLVATRDGYETMTRSLTVHPLDRVTVHVALKQVKPRVVVKTIAPRVTRSFARWIPWSVFAASGASALVASGVWRLARSDYDAFDQRTQNAAGDPPSPVRVSDAEVHGGDVKLQVSRGLFVLSGALSATSVVLWIVNRPRVERVPSRGLVSARSLTGLRFAF